MITREAQVEHDTRAARYCEYAYHVNMMQQIQKVIREKAIQGEERNIGFGFVYLNEPEYKGLRAAFRKQFKSVKSALGRKLREQRTQALQNEEENQLGLELRRPSASPRKSTSSRKSTAVSPRSSMRKSTIYGIDTW
jgi:hypothetical protein